MEYTVTEQPAPRTFQDALDAVYVERACVMCNRQRKYGPDNILSTGLLGIAVRMRDKWERLWRYASKQDETNYADESLRDTLIDLGNYADIALMLLDGTWGLPMEEDSPEEFVEKARERDAR